MTRLGIMLPDLDSLPPEDAVDCARAADEAGFESLWVSEYRYWDTFSVLAAAAAVTNRIKLATGVAVVFNRAPTTMALCAATVDAISKGRLILGLGQGHKAIVQEQMGLEFVHSTQRLIEYTEIIRALICAGQVSYSGQLFKVNFQFSFTPYRPKIPIYFPCLFPKNMELTGQIADGTIAAFLTLDRTSLMVQKVSEGAAKVGRDPAQVDIASLLLTVITKDKQAGRRLIKQHFAHRIGFLPRYRKQMLQSGFAEVEESSKAWQAGDQEGAVNLLSDDFADSVAIIGDLDHCKSRIEEYRRAGIVHPIAYPLPLTAGDAKRCFLEALPLIR